MILNYISLTAKSHLEEDDGWDDMKRWHQKTQTPAYLKKSLPQNGEAYGYLTESLIHS